MIFLILFVCANYLTNTLFINNIQKYTLLYRIDAQFVRKLENIRILVAGDSHSRTSFNPDFLENSFVLASGGENIIETYYRLAYWITNEHADIDVVLLPIDLHSFSSFRSERILQPHFWRKYIDFIELSAVTGKPLDYLPIRLAGEFSYLDGVDETIEVYKYSKGLIHFSELLDGYVAVKSVPEYKFFPVVQVQDRLEIHFLDHDIFDEQLATYFLKTINMLAANDIMIVLVRYPVSRQYYTMAGKMVDIPAYDRQIEQLIEGNGISVTVLDYHDLFWEDARYFTNPDHLNTKGAEVFTRILKTDLERLGLLN